MCISIFFINFATKTNYRIMKKNISILLMAAFVVLLASCKQQKKTDVIITHKQTAPAHKKNQKMSDYEQSRNVEWMGSVYQIVVKRKADNSLPQIQVDDHTKYYDNIISVRILRKDGTEFFNKTFLKTDFRAFLDSDTQKNGALLGVVFVKAENNYLYFAASVGSPDVTSDEYIPLIVKISNLGSVEIKKDSAMDTDGDEKTSSEEEDEV